MGSDLQAEPLQRKRKPSFGATSAEGPRKRPRIAPSYKGSSILLNLIKAGFTEYDDPESEDEVISIRSDVSFSVPTADVKVEPDSSSEASTSPVVAYRSSEGIENVNDLITSTPIPGQTSVIEIDNSPPLVKRELFTSGDVESSSSSNDSEPWVHPLSQLSTSEDASEQADDAPLVPCIPVPATDPIPALYESVDSITLLVSKFVAHIGGVNGGMRKHPESYGLAVKGILEAVGGLRNLTATNVGAKFVAVQIEQKATVVFAGRTVKFKLLALKHFCNFIIFYGTDAPKFLVGHARKIIAMCSTWNASLASRCLEQREARRQSDYDNQLTVEQIRLYRLSDYALRATAILSDPNYKMAGASEFAMPRNHLMCLFNIANANRAGVLTNMTISQVLKALDQQPNNKNLDLVIAVVKHKTVKSYGAAHICVNEEVSQLVRGYIRLREQLLALCGNVNTDAFFLNIQGRRVSKIHDSINACFKNLALPGRVCSSKIRKFASTNIRDFAPEACEKAAAHMKHSTRTAAQYYVTHDNVKNAQRVSTLFNAMTAAPDSLPASGPTSIIPVPDATTAQSEEQAIVPHTPSQAETSATTSRSTERVVRISPYVRLSPLREGVSKPKKSHLRRVRLTPSPPASPTARGEPPASPRAGGDGGGSSSDGDDESVEYVQTPRNQRKKERWLGKPTDILEKLFGAELAGEGFISMRDIKNKFTENPKKLKKLMRCTNLNRGVVYDRIKDRLRFMHSKRNV